jgi:hypothetical protein
MDTLIQLLTIDAIGNWVEDYDWVWPICEIFHYVGMALLIGTVGLLDARILGFAKGIPIGALSKLVPLGILGFSFNVITGLVFVTGNPAGGAAAYFENAAFICKMLLILIAGANLLAYEFSGLARAAHGVPAGGDASGAAKAVAILSLVAWFGVIYFGRMIMYNDTLLYAFGL